MGPKRKLDMDEAEFEFLHDYLVQLSKMSVVDAKSMLLMIKSFAPNSLKLKQIEYGMAKDNGDTNTAAHLLSQLCSTSRDVAYEETRDLFEGLRKSPPDKTSLDIFIRLNYSTQRELFNIFFAKSSCSCAEKADLLLYLLGLKEIQSQVQLTPSLISLAYRVLRDGEASTTKRSDRTHTSKSDESPVSRDQTVNLSNNNRVTARVTDTEEGEEGEVLGDDDDDDDAMLEAKATNDDTDSLKHKAIMCEYRHRLTYELLPIVHQVFDTVKLDRRLLEKIANFALNYIFESMASGLTQTSFSSPDANHVKFPKSLTEHTTDCLQLIASFLQWPLSIVVKHESSNEINSSSATLKSSNELLSILDESWEEVKSDQRQIGHSGEVETSGRKKRRKEDSAYPSMRILSLTHEFVVLWWFQILDAARKHISITRPLFTNCSAVDNTKSLISAYPFDMSLFFPVQSSIDELFTSDTTLIPFSHLARLWRYRKYKYAPDVYTLGSYELDMWDAAVRPTYHTSTHDSMLSLEGIICFDLILGGVLQAPWNSDFPDNAFDEAQLPDLITSVCPQSDQNVIRWILHGCSSNPFSQKAWTSLWKVKEYFVKCFDSVVSELPVETVHPTRLAETCWLIPLTKYNVSYLGCKIITRWLCSKMCLDSPQECTENLDAVCLACVLCQIDTMTRESGFLSELLPLPCQAVLESIEKNWFDIRDRFLPWINPPVSAIIDSSLINELVRLEASWLVKNGANHSDIMDACVSCIKSPGSESICERLRRFVRIELDHILDCLKSVPVCI